MDVIDANAEDVRFLQAMRHGKVATSLELVEDYENELGDNADVVRERLREGESLGIALLHAGVPECAAQETARSFCQRRVSRNIGSPLCARCRRRPSWRARSRKSVDESLLAGRQRQVAQKFGALALVPFIGMLIWHGIDHTVPLFLASFAGFGVALLGIIVRQNAQLGAARREA